MSQKFKKLNKEVIKTEFHQSYYWLNGILSNGNDKDIIQLVSSFQSSNKKFYMTSDKIAQMLHRSESTIAKRIGILEEMGYLKRVTKPVDGKGEKGGRIRTLKVNEDKMIQDYKEKYGLIETTSAPAASTLPESEKDSVEPTSKPMEVIKNDDDSTNVEDDVLKVRPYIMDMVSVDYEKHSFEGVVNEIIGINGNKEYLSLDDIAGTLMKMDDYYKKELQQKPRNGTYRSKVDNIKKIIERIVNKERKAS